MATNEELNKQYKEQLKSVQALERFTKNITSEQKRQLKAEQAKLATIEKRIAVEEAYFDSFDSFSRKYQSLGKEVQKQLTGQAKGSSSIVALNQQIAREKGKETRYSQLNTKASKEGAKTTKQRLEILESISGNLIDQATATQKAEDDLRGVSELQRELRDLAAEEGTLTKKQYELAKNNILQKDQLKQKQETLNELQSQQGELMGMLPAGLQSAIGGAKKLGTAMKAGMGPLFLIGALLIAAVKSFTALEEGAKNFREQTGLTNSQMKDIRSQANQITQEFASTGLEAEDVFNTIAALKSEFSDIAGFSDEVVAGLTLMNVNFGISTESAAKVQGIFEQVGGLSSETATSVGMQAANMARLAGVAPAKVFEDIAENADIASTLFKGDVESLTKAAIEARRLGTNLKSVASTTEHLLDFQSNIGDELVAATFVGGQFSLTQARSLAAAGKTVEAQKEVLRQLQRGGDFRKKDYFTQQQLAKAAGMSVEEINKQLNAQEKLNSLSSEQRELADKAIAQGLDISDINKDQLASQVDQFAKQQEQQAVLEKISNQFMGIASTVGSVLVPVLDVVATLVNLIFTPIQLISDLFGGIGEKISSMVGPLGTVGKILKGLAGLAIVYAAYAAFTAITASTVGFGLPLAIAAAAAITTAGFGLLSKVGDLAIDPNGGPVVASPREGGLFQGTKNDGLMMAPGIGTKGVAGGVGGSSVDTSAIVAAIRETKDVYMDGRRVTSRVASSVEKSTKNQYGFG